MYLWQRIKARLKRGDGNKIAILPQNGGVTPGEQDTQRAIRELSRAVMNNPDTVEIYLALGNLYRARGDVERAVQIRESLLVRPELRNDFKGKTFFELGQDYRRAGMLDRALTAYLEASRLGAPSSLINAELAALYAGTGEWEKAGEYFYALGNTTAEAHYMVKMGAELLIKERRDASKAIRLFEKAVKICPASIEGWSALIGEYILRQKWGPAAKNLQKALERIPSSKSFMIFEEILRVQPEQMENKIFESACTTFYVAMLKAFIPVLDQRPPEIFPNFYGAVLLTRGKYTNEAIQWLDKALVIQPDFWHGRLLRLSLARQRQDPPNSLDADLDFFLAQSNRVKRFMCSVCGLNLEQTFYCCPRCNSWHSADYRFAPHD